MKNIQVLQKIAIRIVNDFIINTQLEANEDNKTHVPYAHF